MKRAIIFDMDGVLVDSEGLHVAVERQVCLEAGIEIPFSEWKGFQGKTDADIFGYIVSHYTDWGLHPNQLVERKRRLFFEQAGKIELIKGADRFIKLARMAFPKLAVATSSGRLYFDKVIGEKYHLDGYFDAVITREDVRFGKPNPEAYLLAAEKLGVAPSECFVIEDSENGIRAALSAGCEVIGIATSLPKKKLESLGVHCATENFGCISLFLGIGI